MRAIVLTPSITKPSQRYIRRHLQMLHEADALAAIITIQAADALRWRDAVPIYDLTYQPTTLQRVGPALRRRVLRQDVPLPTHPQVLRQHLRKWRAADVLLCQFANTAIDFMDVLTESNKRLFVHVHGYDTHAALHDDPAYGDKLAQLGQHAVYLCASEEIRGRLLASGVPAAHTVLKPFGVEIPAYRERGPQPADQPVTILHLGRLVDVKAPELTIRAFGIACDRGLRGRLTIAGEGPLLAACEQEAAATGWQDRIELRGAVTSDEADALYATADIFTLHSIRNPHTKRVEAFGVAIIEAMAAGLPVVGTRIGGPAEIIQHGVTGLLAEPLDVQAQAEAFLQLAQSHDLRRQMGYAGWQRAQAEYSYEREAERLLHILGTG